MVVLLSGEGIYDLLRYEIAGILKGKVTCVEQVQFRLRDVAKVRLGTLHREEGVVFSPDDQRLRLPVAKEFMPLVIVKKIGLVVVKQVELDRIVAGTVEEVLIDGV